MEPKRNVLFVGSSYTVFAVCDEEMMFFLCDRNSEGTEWDLGATKDPRSAKTWNSMDLAERGLDAFRVEGLMAEKDVQELTMIVEITRSETIRPARR